MYKKFFTAVFFTILAVSQGSVADANATKDNNATQEVNASKDLNVTKSVDTNSDKAVDENIKKAIEAEKKFEKEQKFYQGDDYDLNVHKVDKKSVDKVPLIEPEYDFDITDLYAD